MGFDLTRQRSTAERLTEQRASAVQDAVNRLNQRRVWLREGLKNHQPFLVLASLSFVIAAFLRDTAAAGFAALAAIAFLVAMFFSVSLDSVRTPGLAAIMAFYASFGYGFFLLTLDAVVILLSVPGAALGIILGGSLVGLAVEVVALFGLIRRIRRRL